MLTNIEIEITEEDCLEGCRGNERYCIVSTAIARLFPEANRIETNSATIRFTLEETGHKYRYAFPTPEAVREYIRNFDAGIEPHPMTFTLKDPQIVEVAPKPAGIARTKSFKPTGPPKNRRVRVFGEKALQPAVPTAPKRRAGQSV